MKIKMKLNFKEKLFLFLAVAILAGIGLGIGQFFRFNDGKLHLVFCDVGQGDAIYLKTPAGKEILIDGGPNEEVLDCLSSRQPFFDREIDILILTHPEADHLTGLIPVLQRYKVNHFITENIGNPSAVFKKFHDEVVREESKIYNPKPGDKIRLGEVEVDFYWPKTIGDKKIWSDKFDFRDNATGSESSNDYSLVFTVKYKNFSSLLTGDAESPILEQIGLPSEVTILKVPHHGSAGALSKELLGFLKPKLAVISAGGGNRFGHPTKETLKILRDSDIKILRTDQNGEVEIVSDGQRWWIE